MSLIPSSKIQKSNAFPWQEMEGRVLILNSGHNRAHELNETASWVWKAIENDLTYGELFNDMIQEFQVEPNELDGDLRIVLDHMKQQNLIQWVA